MATKARVQNGASGISEGSSRDGDRALEPVDRSGGLGLGSRPAAGTAAAAGSLARVAEASKGAVRGFPCSSVPVSSDNRVFGLLEELIALAKELHPVLILAQGRDQGGLAALQIGDNLLDLGQRVFESGLGFIGHGSIIAPAGLGAASPSAIAEGLTSFSSPWRGLRPQFERIANGSEAFPL